MMMMNLMLLPSIAVRCEDKSRPSFSNSSLRTTSSMTADLSTRNVNRTGSALRKESKLWMKTPSQWQSLETTSLLTWMRMRSTEWKVLIEVRWEITIFKLWLMTDRAMASKVTMPSTGLKKVKYGLSRIKATADPAGHLLQFLLSSPRLPFKTTLLLWDFLSNKELTAPLTQTRIANYSAKPTAHGAAKVAGWRTTGSSLSNKEACSKMTILTKPKTKIASTMQIKLSLTLVQSQISVVTSKTPRMLFKMVLWLSLSELLETAGRTTNQVSLAKLINVLSA